MPNVPPAPSTDVTLIQRLRAESFDTKAWSEFVRLYRSHINRWAMRFGLQSADADDVTQIVLVRLASNIRTFEYDPSRSFRSWLKTLTHHAWYDLLTRYLRKERGTGSDSVQVLLENLEARKSLSETLEEAYDGELFRKILERIQRRVETRTWKAFYATAIEGRSGLEVAKELSMNVATVFVARSKVQRMIREEITKNETY